jgi:hypothetical protein
MTDHNASKHIMTIVQLLANSADHARLSPMQAGILNQSVNELCKYDGNEFVRSFLAMVRDAHDVLSPNTAGKLAGYP